MTKQQLEKQVLKSAYAMALATVTAVLMMLVFQFLDICTTTAYFETTRLTVGIAAMILISVLAFTGLGIAFAIFFPHCKGCGKKIIPIKLYETGKCSHCGYKPLSDIG